MTDPVITIRTTAANVSDMKTEQHRWVCPCGERGPWVGTETEAVGLAELHIAGTALLVSPQCRGVHVVSHKAITMEGS